MTRKEKIEKALDEYEYIEKSAWAEYQSIKSEAVDD